MEDLNVAMMLDHNTSTTPDKPFITAGEQELSFREVDARAQRFANVLAALEVQPGEKLAMLLPNAADFPVCYYGALKRGAVPVPLNVTIPAPELEYFLADSEAAALVAFEPYVDAAAESCKSIHTCRHLIIANQPGSEACHAPARRLTELMSAVPQDAGTAVTRPGDPAVILYTSGTTGRPKGAVLTHFNLYFYSQLLANELWQVGPDDVILMATSGAHAFGLALLNTACFAQAYLSLLERFEIQSFFQTIERDRVTFFIGVPSLAYHMLSAPQAERYDLSSLQSVMLAGTPLHPELARAFQARFKVKLTTGYGMTEGAPITFVTADQAPFAPTESVGTPVWGTTVRIVDEEDRAVLPGELGEIVVRGPQIFQGYYNRPAETAVATREGWFHTGDVGRVDAGGNLFLVDRLKEMIKRSGYSVFPAEVERVLYSHPVVAEAAVIGVPHPVLGEEIQAIVVLKPGANASAVDLIDYCKSQLAAYKYPRIVEFRESLPKGPMGKVMRAALRQQGVG